jgi:ribosomal protein S12 methylthiotransferase accessory factor YcaO
MKGSLNDIAEGLAYRIDADFALRFSLVEVVQNRGVAQLVVWGWQGRQVRQPSVGSVEPTY